MKLIKWIKDGWERLQRRQHDMEYQDGVDWTYHSYYNMGQSLEEIFRFVANGPVTRTPFERGVRDGMIEIQRTLAAKRQEVNQKGEPIDTPFFIGTGQEKADCEKRVAEEMIFIDPHMEAVNALRRRRQYTVKLRMVIGTDNTE